MAPHSSTLAWRIPGMGGAWWAAIYGVAQSWTRLNRLSSSHSRLSIPVGNGIETYVSSIWFMAGAHETPSLLYFNSE